MMESICDKFSSIGVAHLTSTKQCGIRSFLLPSVRPFIDLNEALEHVLSLLVQMFMEVFCKFSKSECHMLFSSFQVNLETL
jgi:hypothetical protein